MASKLPGVKSVFHYPVMIIAQDDLSWEKPQQNRTRSKMDYIGPVFTMSDSAIFQAEAAITKLFCRDFTNTRGNIPVRSRGFERAEVGVARDYDHAEFRVGARQC